MSPRDLLHSIEPIVKNIAFTLKSVRGQILCALITHEKLKIKKTVEETFGCDDILLFTVLIVIMVSSMYTYLQTHQPICIKYAQLFVCRLFLNKTFKNWKKKNKQIYSFQSLSHILHGFSDRRVREKWQGLHCQQLWLSGKIRNHLIHNII